MSQRKRRVALVGATGIAGQQFVAALEGHPWLKIAHLVASHRSAGKSYAEALRDPGSGARRWWCSTEPPEDILGLQVRDGATFEPGDVDLVFSAVESDAARNLEARFAQTTPVVSTASAFRYEEDVPILVPGVNPDHAAMLADQAKTRGWKGWVTPIPNCTTTGLVLALKPIADAFGLRRVIVTSMQGISGAGRSPGVVAMDIIDNIIPYIPNEEEKVARETKKILGISGPDGIRPHEVVVSATCMRAAVIEGHTEAVHLSMERPASPEQVADALRSFDGGQELPSGPKQWIVVHDDPFRPQPRLDRDADGGMATSVGRIRKDEALENGVKFVLVSHNTKMGAAKGAVLVAESLVSRGLL